MIAVETVKTSRPGTRLTLWPRHALADSIAGIRSLVDRSRLLAAPLAVSGPCDDDRVTSRRDNGTPGTDG